MGQNLWTWKITHLPLIENAHGHPNIVTGIARYVKSYYDRGILRYYQRYVRVGADVEIGVVEKSIMVDLKQS